MSNLKQNFAQYIKALQVLFFALFAGAVSLLVLVYFIQPEEAETMPADGLAMYISIVVLTLIAGAFYLGRSRIGAAREVPDLKEKIMAYRAALIHRWAMIEGAVLMAGVFFFLSRNMQLLIAAGLGLMVLLLFFPTRERAIRELEISSSEQSLLDDPNFIVAEVDYRGR